MLARELCWWLSLFVFLINITKENVEQIEQRYVEFNASFGGVYSVKFNSQIIFECYVLGSLLGSGKIKLLL